MNPRYLQRAVELATRGLGRTAPNPPVGAVIVNTAGEIVGEGFHPRAGEPHAEALALRAAGDAAAGADLYCTLEPCCHHGRTPPCTEAIIAAGVRRVCYAMQDPDPRCAGGGAEALRAAGLEVSGPHVDETVSELYEPYLKHKQTGLPFVTLKLACSLDGKVATRTGDSRWITCEASRALVHRWRDHSDAIMVGIGTVLADDPRLTVRLAEDAPSSVGRGLVPRGDRQPLRVVVDSTARTSPEAQVVTGPGQCLIAASASADRARVAALEAAGAQVALLPSDDAGVDLTALLDYLGQRDIMALFVEGGPTLAGALIKRSLIDKYRFFYAPRIFGAEALSACGTLGLDTVSEAQALRLAGLEQLDQDALITAYPCSQD
ncbi:MAG: bifunctional diaminohydroxyphosphoribosylaminopyrimidine deaminase/5-amino-6-(5-phosphoribosylamino)uracil reductase RibD [Armatimonadia bacterium]